MTAPDRSDEVAVGALQNALNAPNAPKPPIQPLRIGLLIASLRGGGAERVCSLLTSHWARCGHHVTLMTFDAPHNDAFTLAPEVERVVIGGAQLTKGRWATLKKNVCRVWRVRRQLRASRLDVTVSFMSVSNSCLAVAGLGTATACIGSERTYPPSMALGRVSEFARWWLYGWLDVVVALTDDGAEWLRAHTLARSVHTIANPVQLPLPNRLPRADPTVWCRPGAHLLLAVGRLNPEKQFDQLIRAFAQASDQASASHPDSPQWQLCVLGEGPLRADLQNLVNELGLQGRVLLPGHVGNMSDWLSVADVFALTSAFEGYPNALLEALACGVPAVAYDCSTGPRELITDGVNGLLVPPGQTQALTQALGRLMSDADLRAQMGRHADLTLDAHAIERISGRWEAVFADVLARGARQAKA